MRRVSGLTAGLLCILAGPVLRGSEELDRQLQRIFDSREFRAGPVGPARWIEHGAAYTTVEARDAGGGSGIVRYETATGRREVLISAAQLTPKGGKPLDIQDYSWSADSQKLLVFTNGQRVWRQNTRGDYWVLDRRTGALKQLGGDAPAASLM